MREADPVTPRTPSSRATGQSRWIAAARFAVSLPARALSGLIWVYQRTLGPALLAMSPHAGCRFSPSCSHYAREALHVHGLVGGVWLTAVRLVKCGPWHPGGDDPVPSKKFSCVKVAKAFPAEG